MKMKFFTAAAVLLLASAGSASAQMHSAWAAPAAPQASAFLTVGGRTTPPIGWVGFCRSHAAECRATPIQPRDATLDAARWNELVRINVSVNAQITPATDMEIYGVEERWTYPTSGRGDCEDYVLLKRRLLIQRGWPESALLITVVRDHNGDGHAVLTVRTSQGDFVLDNVRDDVLVWHRTGYRYVKRQSQWAPDIWVSLQDDNGRGLTVSVQR
jgi:predicted transglutaminase-like cysteine proteinase